MALTLEDVKKLIDAAVKTAKDEVRQQMQGEIDSLKQKVQELENSDATTKLVDAINTWHAGPKVSSNIPPPVFDPRRESATNYLKNLRHI